MCADGDFLVAPQSLLSIVDLMREKTVETYPMIRAMHQQVNSNDIRDLYYLTFVWPNIFSPAIPPTGLGGLQVPVKDGY